MKILESEKILAFMDINPLSIGHCLFIPKEHGMKLHDISDGYLEEILSSIKRVVIALDLENYNILQNNGVIAHQAVSHVHFHLIPKPNDKDGLGIIWKSKSMEETKAAQEKIMQQIKTSIG